VTLAVLLVEDDFELAATLVELLALDTIDCDHAANGHAGHQLVQENHYDVLVLDISLPGMDGLTLCRTLRDQGNDTPILLLTARDTLEDKLSGFDAGTDDYLTKPFQTPELVARIQALANRRSARARTRTIDDLTIDFSRRCASRGERKLALTPTGWRLLETLAHASPDVVSRDELISAVWGQDPPESDSLKVHLHRLRGEVDQVNDVKLMHSVVGQGIRLGVDDAS
jgi:DNA-binding response OmpR family regulator